MIFAIEGIITCCLAIISYFTLTDRPETARWLSAAEKDLAIARVKSERVSVDCTSKRKIANGGQGFDDRGVGQIEYEQDAQGNIQPGEEYI